jgi:hypothetical protein
MKWVIGATVIALFFGVVATMTIPAQTITPDQATLRLLPPETQGVAFIDVAGLRSSGLVQEIIAEKGLPKPPARLQEFVTATGFDIQRDLDQVTVGRISARELLVIAQARYDKFKVEQYLMDKGALPETYLGRPIYHKDEGGLAFIDNLIFAGSYQAVKKAIDQMTLPGSMPLKPALLDSIRTIEAGSQVWVVGELPADLSLALGENRRMPGQFADFLKSLKSGTYQMRVDADIHARATGTFTSADTASALSDMARGLVALAKLQVAQQQDLLHLLDGIQVSNSATTMTVNIEAPGDVLKKLKDVRPRRFIGN